MNKGTYNDAAKRYKHSEKGKASSFAYASRPDVIQRRKEQLQLRLTDPVVWAKYRLTLIKHRAKKRGLPFDLTYQDLVPPTYCPVLGILLILKAEGRGLKAPNTASIDRNIPELGYIKGNVTIMSNRANILRRDGTSEEFKLLSDYLRRFQLP